MYNYNNRDEVPDKYKWDLTDYFKDEKDFNENIKKTKKLIEKLKEYKGCTSSGKTTYEFLTNEINTYSNVLNLYVYSYLKNDECLGKKESIANLNQTKNLMNELEKNTNFFESELLNLNSEEYNSLFTSYKKLNEFKSNLDNIYRKKDHIIPENEENIISELSNSMNHFSDISSNMLNSEHNYGTVKIDEESVTITTNNYNHLLENKDRKIRKKVYNSFYKKLESYATTSASLLNSYVKYNTSLASIHKFESAWDSKLFNLQLNQKVFESLVSAVNENASSMTKYYKLKKKVLALNKIYPYDLRLNLIKTNNEYKIEKGIELIKNALKPLGEKYIEKLNKVFDLHYIDYCGYKGKCSGGYSFGTLNKNSRILLSYNGTLDSVSNIAHEAGHNIHHQFLIENTPLQYRNQAIIVCEVASLTNECLLSDYISKNGKTKEEKLKGLENMIKIITNNFFGAVREGYIEEKFYEEVNNGGTITKELMNTLTETSLKKYYGNVVEFDDLIKSSWITRSHYYRNFYLYSYAVSISVATKLVKEILNGNKEILDNYIKFLSTGSNSNIIDTFKILNIDLEDKNLYIECTKYFNELLNNYEKIYYDKEGE